MSVNAISKKINLRLFKQMHWMFLIHFLWKKPPTHILVVWWHPCFVGPKGYVCVFEFLCNNTPCVWLLLTQMQWQLWLLFQSRSSSIEIPLVDSKKPWCSCHIWFLTHRTHNHHDTCSFNKQLSWAFWSFHRLQSIVQSIDQKLVILSRGFLSSLTFKLQTSQCTMIDSTCDYFSLCVIVKTLRAVHEIVN